MIKENVLEVEFIELWNNYFAWKISYQNEEILPLGCFADDELKVYSCINVFYNLDLDELYIKGKMTEEDYKTNNYNFCTLKKKNLIEDKIRKINEKYGIKKRWRAEIYEDYHFLDDVFEIQESVEMGVEEDIERYKNGNYFRTKEEAEKYAEYMRKCSLKWHENKEDDNDE